MRDVIKILMDVFDATALMRMAVELSAIRATSSDMFREA